MNRKINKTAGFLLKLERLGQGRGQKEICYGICVPSYLSKIERGNADADEQILKKLFERLGIHYETDPEFLKEGEELLRQYFERFQYGLDTEAVYEELMRRRKRLYSSPLVIDFLLARGLSEETEDALLIKMQENMDQAQFSWYCILRGEIEVLPEKKAALFEKAAEGLHNTVGLLYQVWSYYYMGNFSAIHQMENRFAAMALEEGNVFALAEYYYINANAFASVDMEEMMAACYERVRRLIRNTGWEAKMAGGIFYNMGATYLALGRFSLAEKYLDQVPEERCGNQGAESEESAKHNFLLWHKKAWLALSLKKEAEAELYLQKMEKWLFEREAADTPERLMYEELKMRTEPDYLKMPEYLDLLEKLFGKLKKEHTFGYLYQYRNLMTAACEKQRKYKKALDFQKEISSKVEKGAF